MTRPEETEELDEFDCCCEEGLGCDVRAREERRGDMAEIEFPVSETHIRMGQKFFELD